MIPHAFTIQDKNLPTKKIDNGLTDPHHYQHLFRQKQGRRVMRAFAAGGMFVTEVFAYQENVPCGMCTLAELGHWQKPLAGRAEAGGSYLSIVMLTLIILIEP